MLPQKLNSERINPQNLYYMHYRMATVRLDHRENAGRRWWLALSYTTHRSSNTVYQSFWSECNFITVYLEADTKSWGSWRKAEPTRDQKIKETVEYILSLFSKYNPHIELNSHSGGGNFIFGFMDAVSEIPDYVKRISFIDSNYNWVMNVTEINYKNGWKLLPTIAYL